MGLFSGISDFFFGEESENINIDLGEHADAGLKGAEDIERFNQQGIEELARALGITSEQLLPFIQAGGDQLKNLIQGASPEGLDQRLEKIFSTESFGALRDKRARDIESILSAGGMVRSGKAIEEFSNLSPELGFSIESLLNKRSEGIVDRGFNAATNLGQFRAGASGDIASLLQNTGKGFFSGRTGDANRELQRLLGQSNLNLQQDELDLKRGSANRDTFGDLISLGSGIHDKFGRK